MLPLPGTTGFRCPSCRSGKVTVDLLPHAETRVRIVHWPRCRTRWDDVARRYCDLHVIEWLDRQGVSVPDYGWNRPKHRFAQVLG